VRGRARLEYQRGAYLARGLYADQLERWWAVFPRARMLLLSSEEFFRDPPAALDAVGELLGLDRYDWRASQKTVRAYNRHPHGELDQDLRARLCAFFRPHDERLFALLGRDLGWHAKA
jgi:hypothetical protein